MIYALKNVAAFLLPPGIFVVFFFLLAYYLWRRNSRAAQIIMAVTMCFYLLTTSYVGNSLIGSIESMHEPPKRITGDLIILLGGGATLDTPDVNGQGNLSGSAANRLLTALRLQRQLGVPVLVSGGQVFGDSGREADIAKRQLLELGVPEEKIIVENQSLNTRQNAMYTKKEMEIRGLRKPILVTSAFHMERSLQNFAKENIDVTPYPCDYQVSKVNAFYFNKMVPSAGALQNSCLFFREWLGILGGKWQS